jgi:hypothetical protein
MPGLSIAGTSQDYHMPLAITICSHLAALILGPLGDLKRLWHILAILMLPYSRLRLSRDRPPFQGAQMISHVEELRRCSTLLNQPCSISLKLSPNLPVQSLIFRTRG